jgi:hypothetical protein
MPFRVKNVDEVTRAGKSFTKVGNVEGLILVERVLNRVQLYRVRITYFKKQLWRYSDVGLYR